MIRIDAANPSRTAGLEARLRMAGSPEEALVSWLIALPEGVDPARAARIALDGIARSEIEASAPTRLRELLLEVARHQAVHYPAPIRRSRRDRCGVSHREA